MAKNTNNSKDVSGFKMMGIGFLQVKFPNGYSVCADLMAGTNNPKLNRPANNLLLENQQAIVYVRDRSDKMILFVAPDGVERDGFITNTLGFLALMDNVARYSSVPDDELCLVKDEENGENPPEKT